MGIRHIVKGMATYFPWLNKLTCRSTGGTSSARYCYSVWLRHLVMADESGLDTQPQVVAELGPGDSIGAGLAALLSGAERYYALDVVEYADIQGNLDIFDELLALFTDNAPVPDKDEFPDINPSLQSCRFPHHILNRNRLTRALDPSRIQAVRDAVINPGNPGKSGIEIHYFAPWYDSSVIRAESVDMIFSQAVLEHVEDLPGTYEALARWLKADGFMSHQIDFGSHGLAKHWNGHWAYSDLAWKLIRGRRPWLINRQPYSAHRRLLDETGFEIVREVKVTDTSGINRNRLSTRFARLSDDDFETRTAYVLARKKTTISDTPTD